MRHPIIPIRLALLIFGFLGLAPVDGAAQTSPNDEDVRAVIENYCLAVKDTAAERRMAAQTAALTELEARIEGRIGILEREKAALEALIKRGEELRDLAEKELVDIYAGMDPEASALQMEKLDVRLASSVLRQLKPRQASLILNEMKPEIAAKMVRVIASAARKKGEKP